MEPRRTLLCVHPHPDDESIACGGVLAKAAGAGDRTVVVTCTGGEEGENLAGLDLGGRSLVVHRRHELAEALEHLQVAEHVALGYRDSGMAGADANEHPDSFHRADLDEAAARLAAVVRRVRPDVVVSDDERGTYGHPDHIKAHAVTVRALSLAGDPDADVEGAPWIVPKRYVHTLTRSRLLAIHHALTGIGLPSPFGDLELHDVDDLPFGAPDDAVTTVVDVRPWLPAKRAALAAHRTQIGPDSFFLNVPAELAGSVFGTEEFILESGTPGVAGIEADLFDGLSAAGSAPDGPDPGFVPLPDAADAPAEGDAAAGAPHRGDGAEGRPPDLDPTRFRAVLGRFAAGVAVMTSVADGQPHGMTASSVTSVSLDPPLVLVCVDRGTVMAETVTAGGAFALSFLGADQAAVSDAFADPSRPAGEDQFAGVDTHTAVTGVPVLAGAIGWVDTRVWAVHDGGDHVIVVGRVLALDLGEEQGPLVHHGGGYATLAPLDASRTLDGVTRR